MLNSNLVKRELKNLTIPNTFKKEIIKALQQLDHYRGELELNSIYLFGSCAKGTADFGSDIDILIVTNSSDVHDIRCKVINYDIDNDNKSIPVQITVRNLVDFTKCDDSVAFLSSVKKTAILLTNYNETEMSTNAI